MKFGTLLELNSNIEWWDYYVDYDALKKLFPSTPLDPSYRATHQNDESSAILPLRRDSKKYASPENFTQALDKERSKVTEFYKSKFEELTGSFEQLEEEVARLEERDLVQDDTIKEVDEENEDAEGGQGERQDNPSIRETDNLLSPSSSPTRARSPISRPRPSFVGRLGNSFNFGRRKSAALPSPRDPDILEASIQPTYRPLRSPSATRTRMSDSMTSSYFEEPASGRVPKPRSGRRVSDLESSVDDIRTTPGGHDRRASVSSLSSHEGDFNWPRRLYHSLGLVQMDPATVPDWATTSVGDVEEGRNGFLHDPNAKQAIFVWTANNDYATVLRIGLKKRISKVWLDAYALKQYVELNMTAFEKILKKYDKNTDSKLKKQYISQVVLQSVPWTETSKKDLEELLARILFLYRRVVAGGDDDLAREQLRSQLREKVVVDRETVWSQMVSGRNRSEGIFRSVTPDQIASSEPNKNVLKTPFGSLRVPTWLTMKAAMVILAAVSSLLIVQLQPLDRVEESNCMAMLVFCIILWATEAIPLFVTSLAVPFLTVILRVLRSSDGEDGRLSAADATKYIFSQMFSPTIMLLIGGFTIAAVLSKTRLDVMTATRILNAAGSNPSVVLLVLMSVATFASMWISNVAAPTLCYALIKPITDELHPKSNFSKCLIIAIALAANIGGQASPISSPQNLISLGSMDPPLSWLQWFAISIPVSSLSVVLIWAFLHINYRWESDLEIPKMRKNTDPLTVTHYYVLAVSALTILLWCAEKSLEDWVGDMGVIAIVPLLAFFGTGILSKEDFHSFHWSIVFLAMGGIALGKATLSSGLLDMLNNLLERLVEGMGLYSILIVFSMLALVIATFISHTIAAVLLVPIATRIGDSLEEPHPRLLIMATALICSAGMGLPVSGFPNMTAITQENKLGQRFIGASDFLKNGILSSILAMFVIVTVGYAIMRGLGL
ncbi:phosphate transporter [Cryptococcus neoformans Bt85]|nr:phosphate transporter [Cryptococcus neoformans var. grubii Bt85]